MTSDLTPREEGLKWEEDWAQLVGGKTVVGSGNQWHSKLDVRGRKILWSNKWTSKPTFTVNEKLIEEIESATNAPGGVGGYGGMAIRTSIGDFVVMKAEDFLELVKEPAIIQAEKADHRRATARVPALLREQDGT